MRTVGKRILFVDDNNDMCLLLAAWFESGNYKVVTVCSFNEALRLIQVESFDLYILDVQLPGGTGLDLCKRLKALFPDRPIIFFSAMDFHEDRKKGLEAGAQAYIGKPDLEQLFDMVEELLSDSFSAG
jgi:DNA-binding response OmpR family regulator